MKKTLTALALAATAATIGVGAAYGLTRHEVSQATADCRGATFNYVKFGAGGTIHAEIRKNGTVAAAKDVTVTTDTATVRVDADLSGDNQVELRSNWTSADGPGSFSSGVFRLVCSTSTVTTTVPGTTTTVPVTSTVHDTTTVHDTAAAPPPVTTTTTLPAVTVTLPAVTVPAKLAPPKTVTVYRTRTRVVVRTKKVCPPPPTCASLGKGLVGKWPKCGAAAKG